MTKSADPSRQEQIDLLYKVLSTRPGNGAAMEAWKRMAETGTMTEGQVRHLTPMAYHPPFVGRRRTPGCPGEPLCENHYEEVKPPMPKEMTCPRCNQEVFVETLQFHLGGCDVEPTQSYADPDAKVVTIHEAVKPGGIRVIPDPQRRCYPSGWVVIREGDGTLEGDTVQLGLFWSKDLADKFAALVRDGHNPQTELYAATPAEETIDHVDGTTYRLPIKLDDATENGLEQAYWIFDTRVKKTGTSRDAFKDIARGLIRRELTKRLGPDPVEMKDGTLVPKVADDEIARLRAELSTSEAKRREIERTVNAMMPFEYALGLPLLDRVRKFKAEWHREREQLLRNTATFQRQLEAERADSQKRPVNLQALLDWHKEYTHLGPDGLSNPRRILGLFDEIAKLKAVRPTDSASCAYLGALARKVDAQPNYSESRVLELSLIMIETQAEEIAKLKAELEQTRVQLAGCGAEALGYGGDVTPGDYGYSASLEDVRRLRKRWEDLVAKLQHLFEAIRVNTDDDLAHVITRLKQSDGEGWAVGEMLTRALAIRKAIATQCSVPGVTLPVDSRIVVEYIGLKNFVTADDVNKALTPIDPKAPETR